MKLFLHPLFATSLALALILSPTVSAQGTFPPVAGPTTPVMKSLTQVEPRIAIPGGGTYTITSPGNYYLTGDISIPASGTGIAINASDVTLDLNGFTISGTSDPGSTGAAIAALNRTNITIRNGSLSRMGLGISVTGTSAGMIIEDVRISTVYRRGIQITSLSNGSRVKNCTFHQIGGATGFGGSITAIYTSNGVRVEGCHIVSVAPQAGANSYGLDMLGGDSAIGNTISACTIGIAGGKAKDNLFSGCTVNLSSSFDAGGNY